MLNTPLDIQYLINSEIKKAIKDFKVHKYYKDDQKNEIATKLATPKVFLGSLPLDYLYSNIEKSYYPYILTQVTKTEIININSSLIKKIKFRVFSCVECEKNSKNLSSKNLKNLENINDLDNINIPDLCYIDILNLIELLEQNIFSGFNKKIHVDEKSINSSIYLNSENVWESETYFTCFIQALTFSKLD